VSSVAALDREKRHSWNFVLETLQIKTLRATPACNIPRVETEPNEPFNYDAIDVVHAPISTGDIDTCFRFVGAGTNNHTQPCFFMNYVYE